ncbi:hypothetical protein RB595_003769 [Gaeumannomyces hyphopodioides]
MSALKRLLGEISKDEFTDFVLVCGPERFPVHKVIVCSQSKVFHAACSKPFRLGLAASCIHARMFALADMYQVDHLQSLAATKYGKALEKRSNIQDLLDSIPDVYQLTPCSVRALRNKAVTALRVELGRTKRLRQYTAADPTTSGDNSGGGVDSFMAAYDEVATETPEFLKDLLSSYIRTPLLGWCSNCDRKQPQPTEPLQMKCLTCGKGGADRI